MPQLAFELRREKSEKFRQSDEAVVVRVEPGGTAKQQQHHHVLAEQRRNTLDRFECQALKNYQARMLAVLQCPHLPMISSLNFWKKDASLPELRGEPGLDTATTCAPVAQAVSGPVAADREIGRGGWLAAAPSGEHRLWVVWWRKIAD